uniref:Uncharacterized protein n=1 Tax=uncultured prokaryote TaxID=198431 RepID=A0A0H5Q777_9ZZZZ|nr:hypothetical protein [uncultured prokaryote]
MAFVPHTHLTISGTWQGDPEEIWECTLNGTDPGGEPIADLQDFVDGAATIVSTWFTSAGARHAKNAVLKSLKAANIDSAGAYSEAPGIHDYTTLLVGASNATMPGFCSMATTFKTDNFRPPGKYGRMYPPNNGADLMGSSIEANSIFQATAVACQAVADAMGLLLVDLNTDLFIPVVASKTGSGSNTPIRTISVDSIVDTQRSRRNRITGTRYESIYSLVP